MAISHELSSEIATALFSAKERSPRELKDLKEVIFKIHSTLEKLTATRTWPVRVEITPHCTPSPRELPKIVETDRPSEKQ
ncbi:MAG: hypothetical protein H7Z16_11290 [Pyrinomonadaceae bacterium]|nr:hypothetical protein [Pyrinomonadaceae bacterium]